MQIVYEGPHAGGVEVAELDYRHVPRDEPIDVSDEIGQRLCQQAGTWREYAPEKKGGK